MEQQLKENHHMSMVKTKKIKVLKKPNRKHVEERVHKRQVKKPSRKHVVSRVQKRQMKKPSLKHVESRVQKRQMKKHSLKHVKKHVEDGNIPLIKNIISNLSIESKYNELNEILEELVDICQNLQ